MKHDTIMRDGIRSCLKVMNHLLECSAIDTRNAYKHICENEQNMAIGTVMLVDEQLEQALGLFRAIMAMHQFKR